jgi:hypothetical protein
MSDPPDAELKQFSIRLTRDAYNRMRRAAFKEGLSLSMMARRLIDDGARGVLSRKRDEARP